MIVPIRSALVYRGRSFTSAMNADATKKTTSIHASLEESNSSGQSSGPVAASYGHGLHSHRVFSGSAILLKPLTASVIDFSTGMRSAVDPPTYPSSPFTLSKR